MKIPPYDTYKDTGAEWLGHVPAHWRVARVAQLFREVAEAGDDALPVLSVSIHDGVSDAELSPDELDRKVARSEDRSKYKRVQPGDLVYNMMRAWQGGFGTVRVDGAVSPAYVVARPRREITTRFVELLLRTPHAVQEMKRYSKGVTDFRLRLYWEEFKRLSLGLPSTAEQRAILGFLDSETAKIDALVDEQKRLIELLKEKRLAIISHVVTKGLDPRVRLKDSGVEWLGMVPVHWRVVPLRRVAKSVQTGSTPSTQTANAELDSGVAWYTPGDFQNSIRLSVSGKRVSEECIRLREVPLFPAGCVLVVGIGATLGKIGFIDRAASANQQVNAITPGYGTNGYFLAYALSAQSECMKVMSNSSTIGILNQEKTKDIRLAVPPGEEQESIAAHLDCQTAEIDNLIGEMEKAAALLHERRIALIYAAVTGKIDVRGAVTAPAKAA